MATTFDSLPAFPSHGTMGEVAHTGVSTALFLAAHAMQGLIAGAAARNGTQSLSEEDAQRELAALANALGAALLEKVEASALDRYRNWRDRRYDAIEASLRAVLAAADNGDVGQTNELRSALGRAGEQLADDDIPF